MLQIDHIYEFLYQELFKDFMVWHLPSGVPQLEDVNIHDLTIFTSNKDVEKKILFYDQEPLIAGITTNYIDVFKYPWPYTVEESYQLVLEKKLPFGLSGHVPYETHLLDLANPNRVYKEPNVFVTSEISQFNNQLLEKYKMIPLYYFFHGFAALDWYRGYYALNYSKQLVKTYNYDFITFNRIITNDRSYRIYFISLLKEQGLLNQGQISFNVTDNLFDDWRDEVNCPDTKLSDQAKHHIQNHMRDIDKLVIDYDKISGSASSNIPRLLDSWLDPVKHKPADVDSFWHIVTETVFYYDKLHLTEKIFKPIVSKQPFMLLAAPGNLAYLRSYGFRTFDGIIDETYDTITDNDQRIKAVVDQLSWYCNLSEQEKTNVIRAIEPIVLHNFHHFYGEFKHIITQELITNTKTLFQDIGYDDKHINYNNIYHVLTH